MWLQVLPISHQTSLKWQPKLSCDPKGKSQYRTKIVILMSNSFLHNFLTFTESDHEEEDLSPSASPSRLRTPHSRSPSRSALSRSSSKSSPTRTSRTQLAPPSATHRSPSRSSSRAGSRASSASAMVRGKWFGYLLHQIICGLASDTIKTSSHKTRDSSLYLFWLV